MNHIILRAFKGRNLEIGEFFQLLNKYMFKGPLGDLEIKEPNCQVPQLNN